MLSEWRSYNNVPQLLLCIFTLYPTVDLAKNKDVPVIVTQFTYLLCGALLSVVCDNSMHFKWWVTTAFQSTVSGVLCLRHVETSVEICKSHPGIVEQLAFSCRYNFLVNRFGIPRILRNCWHVRLVPSTRATWQRGPFRTKSQACVNDWFAYCHLIYYNEDEDEEEETLLDNKSPI